MYDSVAKKFGGYAPAAYVESWVANVATVSANRFSDSSGSDVDAGRFTAGDVVRVVQGNTESPAVSNAVAINAVSGNAINFGAVEPLPSIGDGYYIVWAGYDNLTSAQQGKGYVAVSDGGYVDATNAVAAWEYGI
jgi:hypothetical protein